MHPPGIIRWWEQGEARWPRTLADPAVTALPAQEGFLGLLEHRGGHSTLSAVLPLHCRIFSTSSGRKITSPPGAGASTHEPFRGTRRDRLVGMKSRCPLRRQEACRRCCASRGVAWRWRGCGRVRRGLRVAPHAGHRVAPEGLHPGRRGPPAWISCSRHTPFEWHTRVAHRGGVCHCTFWLTYRDQGVASGAGGARKPQCTLIYVYLVVFYMFVYMVCHLRHSKDNPAYVCRLRSGAPPANCAMSVPLCATHRVLSPFQKRRPPVPLYGEKPRRFHSSPTRLLLMGRWPLSSHQPL